MNNLGSPIDQPQPRSRYHWSFINVGLWTSTAVLVMLLLVGMWSYQQTNQLVRQSQERAGTVLTKGLANALQENLIIRNYAQLEVQLLQTMTNERVMSILVTDADGRVLSEVRRDPVTGHVAAVFSVVGETLPRLRAGLIRQDHQLEITSPIGDVAQIGWVQINLTINADSALLNGIHVQLMLMLGLAAAIMLAIVAYGLRSTYGRVSTRQKLIETQNDALQSAAFYDALTQLPNRHLLVDRLQQALALAARSQHRVGVCFLDLDGFKAVNDRFGHEAGDVVLIEIAHRLTQTIRQHDTVARIGGDEFVLVVTELQGLSDCESLLDRLLAEVARPVEVGHGHRAQVSASIGIVLSDSLHTDPAELLRQADKAMYAAKAIGKNCWRLFEG